MSTWHYMKNGVQTGPVSTDELKNLLSSGTIRGDTLVWREGLATWAPANAQSEFAGVVPPPSASTSTPPAGPPGVMVPDPADMEKNKVFGVISYLPPLLFIVPLLAARESKFAMYHCNQGLVLTIAAFVFMIVNMILHMILVWIPFVGWMMGSLLHLAFWIGTLVLAVIGIINAANGVCKPLPLIGNRFTLIQ